MNPDGIRDSVRLGDSAAEQELAREIDSAREYARTPIPAAHSPLPWSVDTDHPLCVSAADGGNVALTNLARCNPEDAKLIVTAVNSHAALAAKAALVDELVEAMERAPRTEHPSDERGPCLCSSCEFTRKARALIARAKSLP